MAAPTAHRVLTSCRINRLGHLDRVTGEPVRRYETTRPGELVHLDAPKLGNVPDGGGRRLLGRDEGQRERPARRDPTRSRKVRGRPNLGYCHVHSAIDGYSRPAYSEALDDETAATTLAFFDCSPPLRRPAHRRPNR